MIWKRPVASLLVPSSSSLSLSLSWSSVSSRCLYASFLLRTMMSAAAAAASPTTTAPRAAPLDTSKKCAIVVGLGRGGLGDNLASRFSAGGYNVAMVARSDLSALEAKVPNSRSYRCDAGDPDQVEATVAAIAADMGSNVDALLYNAGSGSFKPFASTTYEDFQSSWKVGPGGVFLWSKACLPNMPVGACIGVTGATASWRGMPATSAFASSKMATRGLVQALARDLGPTRGIHVFHVVIDGIVDLPGSNYGTKKDNNELLDPAAVADVYWNLSQQPPSCWTHETHVGAQGAFGSIASI